ncbi:MAG: SDR family oxidoreductase [Pirellulales bacterium]|nr:SDR family oxidoreductase [Pirellulales bacterium]
MSTKLIFGCGYLGLRVARRWREAGHEVYAVTRSMARAERLREKGIRPFVADVTQPGSLDGLPVADTILYAIGFDRSSGRTMHEVYVGGLRAALDAIPDASGRLIYISSTSVYAQRDGEWVDESSPTEPTRQNGIDCLAAEQTLMKHRSGARAVILRLAGLYGPGRIPRRETLLAGEPIAAAAEGFLNLIHVDDAANVVLAAETNARLPSLYVVADGQPVLRREYYKELARQLGAPAPRFTPPPADAPAAARATTDKRICNARLLAELRPVLSCPSYREGLAAILAEGE